MFFVADLRDAPPICKVEDVNGIPQVGHEEHTTCCLFVVVMQRSTFQWKGQYENAALDTG